MSRKLLAMLLAVVMIVSCLPMSVLAADVEEIEAPSTEVYTEPAEDTAVPEPAAEEVEDAAAAETAADDLPTSGTCGENATWKLDAKGTLTISGTGEIAADEAMSSAAANVKKVVISKGITGIGMGTFESFANMTSVSIPGTVLHIDNCAFMYCTALKSVTIANGVNYIGMDAFCGCSSLTSVSIPKSVGTIAMEAFQSCTSLKTVKFASGVLEIGDFSFCGCTSLKSVTIPKTVTYVGNTAFGGCTSLKTVKFQSKITYVDGQAFYNTPWAAANENEDGMLVINGSLVQCDNPEATSVVIPFGVTTIPLGAFNGCTQLTELVIPADVVTICENAFYYCEALQTVYYTGTEEEWAAVTGTEFVPCTDIEPCYVIGKWVSSGKKKYWYENNVAVTNDFRAIDTEFTYQDESGNEETYTATITYYFDAKGVMATGWKTINGDKYYFDASGAMYQAQSYYDESTGLDYTSAVFMVGNKKTYHFDESGKMLTGWYTETGTYTLEESETTYEYSNTYYFDPKTGAAVTGWKTIDGVKYYFGTYGIMYQEDSYYDEQACLDVKLNVYTISGKNYYFDETGKMLTGFQVYDVLSYDGDTDKYSLIGVMGYFDPKTGAQATGWKTIDGKKFYFDSNENGSMAYGMTPIGKKTYYFATDLEDCQDDNVTAGQLMKNFWYVDADQQAYYFDKNGAMVTKNTKINGTMYYFNADGTCTNYVIGE